MQFFYLFILFIIIVKPKDISNENNEISQTDLLDELTGFQIERGLLYLKINFELIIF